jgi:hypothetical protein
MFVMMCLKAGAGLEILRHFQYLTALVKDGGGLGGSPVNSDGLEKDLEFGVASCNLHVFQCLSCILTGYYVLSINTSSCFTKKKKTKRNHFSERDGYNGFRSFLVG